MGNGGGKKGGKKRVLGFFPPRGGEKSWETEGKKILRWKKKRFWRFFFFSGRGRYKIE